MSKSLLATLLCETVAIQKKDAQRFVEAFFEEITLTLLTGEEVVMTGLGAFRLRDKPERLGRNPRTGEPAVISARRVVTFKPSQRLRTQLALAK